MPTPTIIAASVAASAPLLGVTCTDAARRRDKAKLYIYDLSLNEGV
jgi:hypothetical protein